MTDLQGNREASSSATLSLINEHLRPTSVSHSSHLNCDYFQVLAGPAFILVFIFSAVFLAILSDWLYDKLSRTLMLSVGTATFSTACLLMGLAGQYWQLVILRMLIAGGLSVCR